MLEIRMQPSEISDAFMSVLGTWMYFIEKPQNGNVKSVAIMMLYHNHHAFDAFNALRNSQKIASRLRQAFAPIVFTPAEPTLTPLPALRLTACPQDCYAYLINK